MAAMFLSGQRQKAQGALMPKAEGPLNCFSGPSVCLSGCYTVGSLSSSVLPNAAAAASGPPTSAWLTPAAEKPETG